MFATLKTNHSKTGRSLMKPAIDGQPVPVVLKSILFTTIFLLDITKRVSTLLSAYLKRK